MMKVINTSKLLGNLLIFSKKQIQSPDFELLRKSNVFIYTIKEEKVPYVFFNFKDVKPILKNSIIAYFPGSHEFGYLLWSKINNVKFTQKIQIPEHFIWYYNTFISGFEERFLEILKKSILMNSITCLVPDFGPFIIDNLDEKYLSRIKPSSRENLIKSLFSLIHDDIGKLNFGGYPHVSEKNTTFPNVQINKVNNSGTVTFYTVVYRDNAYEISQVTSVIEDNKIIKPSQLPVKPVSIVDIHRMDFSDKILLSYDLMAGNLLYYYSIPHDRVEALKLNKVYIVGVRPIKSSETPAKGYVVFKEFKHYKEAIKEVKYMDNSLL